MGVNLKGTLEWWLPVLLMVLIAPFTPVWDLAIEHFFYKEGHFVENPLTSFMYKYGFWPADILTGIALLVVILALFFDKCYRWRREALMLIMTYAIGAGLITHAVLKDHWGRPRPRQVVEFGGTQPFRAFYEPNFADNSKSFQSFTCGHCTAGFVFFFIVMIGRRRKNPALISLGWALALGLGIALGITRMAQGGHFLTDVLMSALIMWETALLCDRLLLRGIEMRTGLPANKSSNI